MKLLAPAIAFQQCVLGQVGLASRENSPRALSARRSSRCRRYAPPPHGGCAAVQAHHLSDAESKLLRYLGTCGCNPGHGDPGSQPAPSKAKPNRAEASMWRKGARRETVASTCWHLGLWGEIALTTLAIRRGPVGWGTALCAALSLPAMTSTVSAEVPWRRTTRWAARAPPSPCASPPPPPPCCPYPTPSPAGGSSGGESGWRRCFAPPALAPAPTATDDDDAPAPPPLRSITSGGV